MCESLDYRFDLRDPCVGVPSLAAEELFRGRNDDLDCTDVPISSQMDFNITIMQETRVLFFLIFELLFICRAGNLRRQ